MLSSSPLLDLVRAGAYVMLLFSAILILVVIRNLENVKFGTRVGPLLVGVGLVLFALPIYGDVAGAEILVRPSPILRIIAAALLLAGLYLMKPLSRHHSGGEAEESVE